MIIAVDSFAGIGGFHLAFKNALKLNNLDGKVSFAIEKDSKARGTYSENFKQTITLEDVIDIDTNKLGQFDIIFGGIPCQAFSTNGKYHKTKDKRISETDLRKDLYIHFSKILTESQPKFFIVENVKGLEKIRDSDGKLMLSKFLESFDNSGYECTFRVMCASDFQLPQQRKRIVIIGIRKDISKGYTFPKKMEQTLCLNDIKDNVLDESLLIENLWKNRTTKKILVDGQVIPRLESLKMFYKQDKIIDTKQNKIVLMSVITGDTPSNISRQTDRLYSRFGISPTITTFSIPVVDFEEGWRTLSPRECARCQGFPEDFLIHTNKTVAYKHFGNSIPVNMFTQVISNLLEQYKDEF